MFSKLVHLQKNLVYMSVVAKAMMSGAISDITTAHCYTGEDVVAATTKAAGMQYTPPTG